MVSQSFGSRTFVRINNPTMKKNPIEMIASL